MEELVFSHSSSRKKTDDSLTKNEKHTASYRNNGYILVLGPDSRPCPIPDTVVEKLRISKHDGILIKDDTKKFIESCNFQYIVTDKPHNSTDSEIFIPRSSVFSSPSTRV